MRKELVSAIITTHNRSPEFVLRAINSVLKQTYDLIEIIVVDDSTENYLQRSEIEYEVRQASADIIYIKHTTNRGACVARNTGLSVSKGFYVAFLDDDDEWYPEKIEEQVKGFINSDIAMVCCGFTIINELSNKKYIGSTDFTNGYIFKSLLNQNFIGNTSNPLIKKECLDEVGYFDTRMQSAQDYDLWLRITMKYPVNYIKKPLLNYYIHDHERISSDIDKQIAGQERINDKYSEFINCDNKIWYMRHSVLIPLYVKKGWKKKAYYLWYECVKKSPVSILNNIKQLLIISFGYDSFLYTLYRKSKQQLLE